MKYSTFKYGTGIYEGSMGNLIITNTVSEVWLRGRVISAEEDTMTPLGVYSSQQLADAACIETNEFIGPVSLDLGWPNPGNWPRAYYPRRIL